jgi:organic hydroperoxide reductase OsmC/OhrA
MAQRSPRLSPAKVKPFCILRFTWDSLVSRAMSEPRATIHWERASPDFCQGKYSRVHHWSFDGGATFLASPSPAYVPLPFSDPALVDPEEAFVAAISSCHMLTFLYLASRQGFQIDRYTDEAIGVMSKNKQGIPWVSAVTLSPRITYSGERRPTPTEAEHLHHQAHEQCFIANSVKTAVTVRDGGGSAPSATSAGSC